jgi:hypothetical protein
MSLVRNEQLSGDRREDLDKQRDMSLCLLCLIFFMSNNAQYFGEELKEMHWARHGKM